MADELTDLYSELVMIDSHIAGLVSKYIKGAPIDLSLLHVDKTFNIQISELSEGSDSIREMVDYKCKIDALIQMIEQFEREDTQER